MKQCNQAEVDAKAHILGRSVCPGNQDQSNKPGRLATRKKRENG